MYIKQDDVIEVLRQLGLEEYGKAAEERDKASGQALIEAKSQYAGDKFMVAVSLIEAMDTTHDVYPDENKPTDAVAAAPKPRRKPGPKPRVMSMAAKPKRARAARTPNSRSTTRSTTSTQGKRTRK